MNDSKSIFRHAAGFPLVALMFASLIGVSLTIFRIQWTHNGYYLFLIWNLLLAWLPLVFALGVYRRHLRGERNGWPLAGLAGLWLLFFPNAPYIFTDLFHLTNRFLEHFWVDLSLVLLVAFTGFLLGFVSLYLMHSIMAERFGRTAGWLFIAVMAPLSAFGIYLGRFLRWNSWDVVVSPWRISNSIAHLATHPLTNPISVAFPLLFATFLFLGYLMLYALTHLQPLRRPGV